MSSSLTTTSGKGPPSILYRREKERQNLFVSKEGKRGSRLYSSILHFGRSENRRKEGGGVRIGTPFLLCDLDEKRKEG